MKNLVKAIVFDEFSNEAPKLTYILDEAKGQKQLLEEQKKKVEEKLGVRSFEEFLDKFAPTIYPVVTQDNIEWTLESNGEKGIKLNLDYKPLKLLIDLMDKRKVSGQSKLEFNWQDALQAILPKSMVEDAKYLRGKLEYLTKEAMELDSTNPKYKEITKQIIDGRKKIIEIYRDNPMNLLPLAINDCEKKIEKLSYVPNNKTIESKSKQIGYLKFNEKGEVKFEKIEVKQEETMPSVIDNQVTSKVQGWLEKDYSSLVKSKNQEENPYIKNLIINNFSNVTNQVVEDVNVEEIKERHQVQVEIYKKTLQGSFDSLNKILSKILGIKAFFEQGNDKEKPMLIITNEKITELAKHKDLVETYCKTLNKERFYENSDYGANIWLGIIPGIMTGGTLEEEIDFDIEDAVIIEEENTIETNTMTSISAAKEIMSILKKCKIMTLFNFEANEESTIEEIQKNGIDSFKEEVSNLKLEESPYYVPCYPNFCIVDNKDFKVDIKTVRQDAPLYLKGIYVDAAYVAAGLVTAYLEPKNLIEKFGLKKSEINLEYPGVRINLEEVTYKTKIRSSMAKESNEGLVSEVKEEIREFKTGFIFSCDESIDTMFVFMCRSTDKNPIYMTLTSDYILKKFNAEIEEKELLKAQSLKNGVIRDWEKERDKKNVIIKENDKIEILENGEIEITFENTTKPIQLNIKINNKGE